MTIDVGEYFSQNLTTEIDKGLSLLKIVHGSVRFIFWSISFYLPKNTKITVCTTHSLNALNACGASRNGLHEKRQNEFHGRVAQFRKLSDLEIMGEEKLVNKMSNRS